MVTLTLEEYGGEMVTFVNATKNACLQEIQAGREEIQAGRDHRDMLSESIYYLQSELETAISVAFILAFKIAWGYVQRKFIADKTVKQRANLELEALSQTSTESESPV